MELDLVFGSRDAPHACSGRRCTASVSRRYPRAGSGAGPGLRITGRPACLFRVPPRDRLSPLVRRNRKRTLVVAEHTVCSLAMWTARTYDCALTLAHCPTRRAAAVRAPQQCSSSHWQCHRCLQDVASRTHACSGRTTVQLPSAWHAEAHGSLRGWLGAASLASPRTRCVRSTRCPYLPILPSRRGDSPSL